MSAENKKNLAILYSKTEPTNAQKEKFSAFIKQKYGEDFEFVWEKDETVKGGFRLSVGSEVYDWTVSGRYLQLKKELRSINTDGKNIVSLIKETMENFSPKAVSNEIGTVISVGDGIATVSGLEKVFYGEIVLFESGAKGMVLDLDKKEVGCILFDSDDEIVQGSKVFRTEKTAGIPVGEDFLGRVIDPLGNPLDNKGEIYATDFLPIENPAPSIIDRKPVSKAMETGILAIDSMFPIGRGQRELIIGDRQTGKTAIALDTIVNQKGKNVICIYVAIGQKSSSVAKIYNTLKEKGALSYTSIVLASASDPAPLLYIAPYSATALGEYFMNKGKDVLIVYDDLSKHAVAYRSLSLLLGRSPGREAYPGDVFYLHSRLLERSAHLSDEKGGGSMTALPIVETQSGDVSAYIPTNIISITDGQIFLETNLFFAGQRPAVSVGLSVSRVGGDAQTKATKKATKTLRLDLAQYREMEVFTQFSSDLDESTKQKIAYGKGLMTVLKQDEFSPLSQTEQVITLIAALGKTMAKIPENKIKIFQTELIKHVEENAPEICEYIAKNGDFDDEMRETIISLSKEFSENFDR